MCNNRIQLCLHSGAGNHIALTINNSSNLQNIHQTYQQSLSKEPRFLPPGFLKFQPRALGDFPTGVRHKMAAPIEQLLQHLGKETGTKDCFQKLHQQDLDCGKENRHFSEVPLLSGVSHSVHTTSLTTYDVFHQLHPQPSTCTHLLSLKYNFREYSILNAPPWSMSTRMKYAT